jgi:hypothetical protein
VAIHRHAVIELQQQLGPPEACEIGEDQHRQRLPVIDRQLALRHEQAAWPPGRRRHRCRKADGVAREILRPDDAQRLQILRQH